MASGRLGHKQILQYSSCEVYNNSSGCSASITVQAAVNNSSETNSKISVAIAPGGTAVKCITTDITGTTSQFCSPVGLNFDSNAGYTQATGAYSLKSNTNSRVGSFTNSSCLTTTAPGSATVAPYGGNEIHLPSLGTQNFISWSAGIPDVPKSSFVTTGLDGSTPLYLTDRSYCNSIEIAGQIFTNPYCNCGCTSAGYSYSTYGTCSIEYTTCKLKENGVTHYVIDNYSIKNDCSIAKDLCCCSGQTTCKPNVFERYISCQMNNYSRSTSGNGYHGLFTGLSTPVDGSFVFQYGIGYYAECSIAPGSQSLCPAVLYEYHDSICKKVFSGNCCPTLCLHWVDQMIKYATGCTIELCDTFWCCNFCCGNKMSPYGVQRAASNCIMAWAFCNGVDGKTCKSGQQCCHSKNCYYYVRKVTQPTTQTGYWITTTKHYSQISPGCCCCVCSGDGYGGHAWGYPCRYTSAYCFWTQGLWLQLSSHHCCEYPMKYLAYNPNKDCTLMAIRSTDSDCCGIFCILPCLKAWCCCCGHCNAPYTCYTCQMQAQVMVPCIYETPSEKTEHIGCMSTTVGPNVTKFKKVSDFPKTWDNIKYTSPFMCVSCLFKSDTNLWSIALYNHTESKWDPYVTNDLISWRPANTESNFDASYGSQQAYQVFGTCVVGSQNLYSSNVPLDGVLDVDVVANNYERTGIVISNGDSVIVNNDSQNAISAQVWGYEG